MSRANIPDSILNKINSLNDLQLRMLVSQSLDQQRRISNDASANDDLKQALAYWSKLERQKIGYGDASIDETMDVAHRIFGKESLRSNGEFANYIKSFAVTNPVESARLMKLFCSCLILADAKNPEQQEEFFMSFPPSGDDLRCLDGTQERLEIIERSLSSNESFFSFIQASDLVIRKITDALKYYVDEGNQVHIPKYLEKSLSLIADHAPPYAQSQIPFVKSIAIHEYYSRAFKKFLLIDIGSLLEGKFKEINETIRDLRSKLPGRNFMEIKEDDNDALREVKLGLKKFGDDFIGYDEKEGVGYYFLIRDALNAAACDLPCLRFLDRLRIETNFAEAGIISTDENLINSRKSLLDPENIFSTKASDNLAILATIGTPNDKVFALDIVWMLGQKLLSSSRKIFFDTVELILQNNPNLFDEARVELEKFLPGYSNKIEDILQQYQFLATNDEFHKTDMGSHTYDLIDFGFNTNSICSKILSFSRFESLNNELNVVEDGVVNEQNVQSCRALVNRPDLGNILGAIKHKSAGSEVDRNFVKTCLHFLKKQRMFDEYYAVVKEIGNSSAFSRSNIFHLLAESNRGDLIRDLAPMIQDHPEFLLQDLEDEFPLDLAVRKGSRNAIEEILKILGPKDGDHPRLSQEGILLSHVAAYHGQVESMRALSEGGYDIFARDANGNNAVHYAAHCNKKNILEVLHDLSSADTWASDVINVKGSRGKTPLLLAFERNNKDLIGWMYQHGANPSIVDDAGKSPILLAFDRNDAELFKELAKAGFDLSMYNQENGTIAPYRLLKYKNNDAVAALIKAGFDISAYNKHIGGTLAHYVVEKDPSMLPTLASFGADLSVPDLRGVTPLIKAFQLDSRGEAVRILMGMNPNFREEFRIALDLCNENSFMILQALGADSSIVDDNGFAADYLAIKSGMSAVASTINDERFHSIIIDAIDKDDVAMLEILYNRSLWRSGNDEGRENVMLNRRQIYADYVAKSATSAEVKEFIESIIERNKQEEGRTQESALGKRKATAVETDSSQSDRKMNQPSKLNSIDVHSPEASQVAAAPPRPAVKISSEVNSQRNEPTSPGIVAKPLANDNSTGQLK